VHSERPVAPGVSPGRRGGGRGGTRGGRGGTGARDRARGLRVRPGLGSRTARAPSRRRRCGPPVRAWHRRLPDALDASERRSAPRWPRRSRRRRGARRRGAGIRSPRDVHGAFRAACTRDRPKRRLAARTCGQPIPRSRAGLVRRSNRTTAHVPEPRRRVTLPRGTDARKAERGARAFVNVWIDCFAKHNLLAYASAIAFQILIALVPLSVLTLGVLGALDEQSVSRRSSSSSAARRTS